MKSDPCRIEFSEPERYELDEGAYYHFETDRRTFVKILGVGLLISSVAPYSSLSQRSRSRRVAGPSDRLHIGEDGRITVLTSKVEVGQGSRTQITQAAGEELNVNLDRIRLIMADSALVPDDGGTAGSRTTPSTVPAVRQACAAARELLIDTAARAWSRDRSSLEFRKGALMVKGTASNGQRFGYAELAKEAYAVDWRERAAGDVSIVPVSNWRILGVSVARVGGREIVTGKHKYPSDIVRPKMLHGVVLRPAAFGARLTAIDLKPAQRDADVVVVRDGDFVGCAAPTSLAARDARDAVAHTARWAVSDTATSETLISDLKKSASTPGRVSRRGHGDQTLDASPVTHKASYFVPYIQHAPMEPRAAVAEWKGSELTVWVGTQQPSRVHGQLAESFQLSREQVRVIVPDTGGGFGGKHTGEVAVEAARLARAAGRPVSVRWSREEEFSWAYFRPAGVMELAAGMDEEGQVTSWRHLNFNAGSSALDTPYEIAKVHTEFLRSKQPLRSGSYRALASTANVFARECFMDELAAIRGADPLAFRMRHLTNDRLRDVLVVATDQFRWRDQWNSFAGERSTGVGLACGTEKASFLATCAKVKTTPDRLGYQVTHVAVAFECGKIQNPNNLRSQIEGCVIQGLGAVLRESIRFANGKILNPRFSSYLVPRFRDVPEIEVVLLDRADLESVGGGEPPIIGIAPAIGNAIANAVGRRLRSLPLQLRA